MASRLSAGDKVGLVCPSAPFTPALAEQLAAGLAVLKQKLKLEPELSENFKAQDRLGSSAGSAAQRAQDINHFFARQDIKAIWCFQGGDTANQILDLLDYDLIRSQPKIFIG